MVDSITVLAIMGMNCLAATEVNFDNSLTNFDFNSHGQPVSTYNKLNMSNYGECAEPLSLRGQRTWLI